VLKGEITIADGVLQRFEFSKYNRNFCFGIQPAANSRIYVLQADSKQLMDNWIEFLRIKKAVDPMYVGRDNPSANVPTSWSAQLAEQHDIERRRSTTEQKSSVVVPAESKQSDATSDANATSTETDEAVKDEIAPADSKQTAAVPNCSSSVPEPIEDTHVYDDDGDGGDDGNSGITSSNGTDVIANAVQTHDSESAVDTIPSHIQDSTVYDTVDDVDGPDDLTAAIADASISQQAHTNDDDSVYVYEQKLDDYDAYVVDCDGYGDYGAIEESKTESVTDTGAYSGASDYDGYDPYAGADSATETVYNQHDYDPIFGNAEANDFNSEGCDLPAIRGQHDEKFANPELAIDRPGQNDTVFTAGMFGNAHRDDHINDHGLDMPELKHQSSVFAPVQISVTLAGLLGNPHRQWNTEYQTLLDQSTSSAESETQRIAHLCRLSNEFSLLARYLGRTIISEASLPTSAKSVKPVDAGGIAGGEKFISHGIFFKRVSDERGIYGSDEGAMKAASLELHGARAFVDIVPELRTPLMTIVDFRGFRIVAVCLLPVNGQTLQYGSANAGRTVFCDPQIAHHMCEAGRIINIKEHIVGEHPTQASLIGPCDIEVHRGTDDRFYVLDTARVFPPQAPNRELRCVYMPFSLKSDMATFDVGNQHNLRELLGRLLFPTSSVDVFSCLASMVDDQYRKAGLTDCYVNVPVYSNAILRSQDIAPEQSEFWLGVPLDGVGARLIQIRGTALQLVYSGVGPVNARASQLVRQRVCGHALLLHRPQGGHLYQMLRPEFVKRFRTPLSSDAFTGFGRHNSDEHNSEVAAATQYLLSTTIPTFAHELEARSVIITSGRMLTKEMHHRGINVRYLGVLRNHINVRAGRERSLILTEMLVRYAKQSLRARLRNLDAADDQEYAVVVLKFFNMIFGTSEASRVFWRVQAAVGLKIKFGIIFTMEELRRASSAKPRRRLHSALRAYIDDTILLNELQERTGVRLRPSINRAFAERPFLFSTRDHPFKLSDLESLNATETRISWTPYALMQTLQKRFIATGHTMHDASYHELKALHEAVQSSFAPDSPQVVQSHLALTQCIITTLERKEALPDEAKLEEAIEHMNTAWEIAEKRLPNNDAHIMIMWLRARTAQADGRFEEALSLFEQTYMLLCIVYGDLSKVAFTTDQVENNLVAKHIGNQALQSIRILRGNPAMVVVFNHIAHVCEVLLERELPARLVNKATEVVQMYPPPTNSDALRHAFGEEVPPLFFVIMRNRNMDLEKLFKMLEASVTNTIGVLRGAEFEDAAASMHIAWTSAVDQVRSIHTWDSVEFLDLTEGGDEEPLSRQASAESEIAPDDIIEDNWIIPSSLKPNVDANNEIMGTWQQHDIGSYVLVRNVTRTETVTASQESISHSQTVLMSKHGIAHRTLIISLTYAMERLSHPFICEPTRVLPPTFTMHDDTKVITIGDLHIRCQKWSSEPEKSTSTFGNVTTLWFTSWVPVGHSANTCVALESCSRTETQSPSGKLHTSSTMRITRFDVPFELNGTPYLGFMQESTTISDAHMNQDGAVTLFTHCHQIPGTVVRTESKLAPNRDSVIHTISELVEVGQMDLDEMNSLVAAAEAKRDELKQYTIDARTAQANTAAATQAAIANARKAVAKAKARAATAVKRAKAKAAGLEWNSEEEEEEEEEEEDTTGGDNGPPVGAVTTTATASTSTAASSTFDSGSAYYEQMRDDALARGAQVRAQVEAAKAKAKAQMEAAKAKAAAIRAAAEARAAAAREAAARKAASNK
jgi:Clustered mitochondria/Translation initiation factor eIF3 subunit 135